MKRTLILILIFTVLVLSSCHETPVEESYNDIQLFIDEDYADLTKVDGEAIWWKKEAGVYAKDFFPKYEKIEYKYSSISFNIWCKKTTAFMDVSFVLEMRFDSSEEYEKAKVDILAQNNFLQDKIRDDDGIGFLIPNHEYNIGDFLVKIVTNGAEKDNYPTHIPAIAFNDSNKALKYIFIYESNDTTVGRSLESSFKKLCNGN